MNLEELETRSEDVAVGCCDTDEENEYEEAYDELREARDLLYEAMTILGFVGDRSMVPTLAYVDRLRMIDLAERVRNYLIDTDEEQEEEEETEEE